MGILDQKGRLFGKVNLLDLVVVLAVLAVAARFAYGRLAGSKQGDVPQQTATVTFKLASVAQDTVDAIHKGDKMWDSKTNVYLGNVIDMNSQPAKVVQEASDGRLHETVSSDRFDLLVTIEGPAWATADKVVVMGGNEMKVGRANFLTTPGWAGAGPTTVVKLGPTR